MTKIKLFHIKKVVSTCFPCLGFFLDHSRIPNRLSTGSCTRHYRVKSECKNIFETSRVYTSAFCRPNFKPKNFSLFTFYSIVHSACSKIGKKVQFQKNKNTFLWFQKWQKINFSTRKKFKSTKNPVFSVRKLHFW